MNSLRWLLLLQFAAFWPVWQWYAKRFAAGNPDDQWCLLAAATAIAFLWYDRHTSSPGEIPSKQSWLPISLIVFYAATFHWLPPLLRAVIAMTAIGVTISQCLLGRAMRLAIGGLFILSLPVVPLLQFYLGYPLRIVVGSITAPLLQFSGLAVMREGTSLNWNGQLISIDAPCSGIKMLWAGLFLCCAVAELCRLSAVKTMLAGLVSLIIIIVGNILRASSLFYLEAEIIQLPINQNLAHDSVGVVTFVFAAIGIVASIRWLQRSSFAKPIQLCEPSPRSFSPVS